MTAINRLVASWRRRKLGAGAMDRAYVSEFTHFIEDFLRNHPETVPDDGYGFYSSAWRRPKQ